jgi:hypothetical protein
MPHVFSEGCEANTVVFRCVKCDVALCHAQVLCLNLTSSWILDVSQSFQHRKFVYVLKLVFPSPLSSRHRYRPRYAETVSFFFILLGGIVGSTSKFTFNLEAKFQSRWCEDDPRESWLPGGDEVLCVFSIQAGSQYGTYIHFMLFVICLCLVNKLFCLLSTSAYCTFCSRTLLRENGWASNYASRQCSTWSLIFAS